jgi:hypothetical protein
MLRDRLTLPSTDREIRRIGSADVGQRPIHWDPLVPGLGLRVTEAGRETWVVVRRARGGKLVNHTVGTYPAFPLSVAREEARRVLLTLAQGVTPREARAAELAARGPSFEEVAEDYIKLWVEVERKTEKDRREVAARIRRELGARWRGRPAREIRNRDAVLMVREIIRSGGGKAAPGSRRKAGGMNAARHALSDARALFNWAVEQDLYGITGNPIVIKAKRARGADPATDTGGRRAARDLARVVRAQAPPLRHHPPDADDHRPAAQRGRARDVE